MDNIQQEEMNDQGKKDMDESSIHSCLSEISHLEKTPYWMVLNRLQPGDQDQNQQY
jgi:hypothetical protein